MRFNTLVIILLIISNLASGQTTTTTTTKYYNDLSSVLSPEVPKEHALFSKSVISNDDGTKTFEEFDIKKNKLISRKTYLRREPYGMWMLKKNNRAVELDYNFKLNYITKKDELCTDTLLSNQISNILEDNDSLGYRAPKLSSTNSLFQEIQEKFVYPKKLSGFGISGKTYAQFSISDSGDIEDIFIRKKNMIDLDKEAVRVLRNIKFSEPPKLNGKPINVCVTLPVGYKTN